MNSAPSVRRRKTGREYSPTLIPKAAPVLYTRLKRTTSPMTARGYGDSHATAIHFVITSLITTDAITPQNNPASALLLSIFLTLLAGDAQARVGERVEPIEIDVLTAVVALTEGLRRAI